MGHNRYFSILLKYLVIPDAQKCLFIRWCRVRFPNGAPNAGSFGIRPGESPFSTAMRTFCASGAQFWSEAGKTRLANILRERDWFHYSGDYRIGTRYLDEPILDNIKDKVMQVPFLRDLLRTDSIYIRNNITVNNLNPVSSFLGKLGNPEKDGDIFRMNLT